MPPPSDGAQFFGALADRLRTSAGSEWRQHARPEQLPPPGLWWVIWLLLAGRGFGKTRTVNEFVRMHVEAGTAGRIALVAATAADARDVLVEGPAGLLAISPDHNRPVYEPSKRRLTWPNGAIATTFSADEPDRLRGPQHDLAVCDELATWSSGAEAWDMLMMGLRLGGHPRVAVATTPRPVKIIRDLLAREGKDVVVTRGRTLDNRANLAPQFLSQVVARYAGTRLGRQELEGELLEDTPGALWSRRLIEETRVTQAPEMRRIVIAVDPAGSSAEGADETGIIVCGCGADHHGHVLDDLSGRYTPTEWARVVAGAYEAWKADRVIIEKNYGGEMVAATLQSVAPTLAITEVSASRGKVLRAEPISAFFEQHRCHIVGARPQLEDQMCAFTSDWDRARDGSPDRVDAMVFALTELMASANSMVIWEKLGRDELEAEPTAIAAVAPTSVSAPPSGDPAPGLGGVQPSQEQSLDSWQRPTGGVDIEAVRRRDAEERQRAAAELQARIEYDNARERAALAERERRMALELQAGRVA